MAFLAFCVLLGVVLTVALYSGLCAFAEEEERRVM